MAKQKLPTAEQIELERKVENLLAVDRMNQFRVGRSMTVFDAVVEFTKNIDQDDIKQLLSAELIERLRSETPKRTIKPSSLSDWQDGVSRS